MSKDVEIEIDELYTIKRSAQKIIDQIDNKLSQNSENCKKLIDHGYVSNKNLSNKDEEDEETEPTHKEKEIIKFISNNPGCSKEYVAANMDFSRPITLKYIKNLIKYGRIISEKDISNAKKYLLYVNRESSLSTIISNLQSFEKSYVDLILKMELVNFDNISNEFTANTKIIYSDVLTALFTPFKILMHIFQFTLLFGDENYTKRHNHFFKRIIYDTFEQISKNLISTSVIKKIQQNKENVYFNYYRSIKDIPDTVDEMLKVMKLCKLDIEIEQVMDDLWRICFPYLPFLDPFFSRYSDEELKNWREIMNGFRSSIYSKRRKFDPFLHKVMSNG